MTQNTIWVTPNKYRGKDFPIGPTPEKAGLVGGGEYLVVDIINDTNPDSEMFLVVINDNGELWHVSNRHLRVSSVYTPEGSVVSMYPNPHR